MATISEKYDQFRAKIGPSHGWTTPCQCGPNPGHKGGYACHNPAKIPSPYGGREGGVAQAISAGIEILCVFCVEHHRPKRRS